MVKRQRTRGQVLMSICETSAIIYECSFRSFINYSEILVELINKDEGLRWIVISCTIKLTLTTWQLDDDVRAMRLDCILFPKNLFVTLRFRNIFATFLTLYFSYCKISNISTISHNLGRFLSVLNSWTRWWLVVFWGSEKHVSCLKFVDPPTLPARCFNP